MTEAESDVDRAGLIARRKKLLGPAYSLFYDKPVHLVKGEGVWLFDADGNKYLDMYNNVPHVQIFVIVATYYFGITRSYPEFLFFMALFLLIAGIIAGRINKIE